MKTKLFLTIAFLLCCSTLVLAQTYVHVQKAKMSVPFGDVKGNLLLVEDLLIFMNEKDYESSFAIHRREIARIDALDKELFVETREPIRDQAGSRTRLAFRLEDRNTAPVLAWFERRQTVPQAETIAEMVAPDVRVPLKIYDAKHKHSFFGSCQGKLVISENLISYESLSNRSHSRQYPFTDIKKLKRTGPYELEVETYNRGSYKFDLQGSGMDIADFRNLEEAIAAVRASR